MNLEGVAFAGIQSLKLQLQHMAWLHSQNYFILKLFTVCKDTFVSITGVYGKVIILYKCKKVDFVEFLVQLLGRFCRELHSSCGINLSPYTVVVGVRRVINDDFPVLNGYSVEVTRLHNGE